MPTFFVISIAFLLVWTIPGSSFVSYGLLSLTAAGVAFLLSLMMGTLSGVTYSLVLLMTMKYNHLTHIVARVLPYALDQIALLAYRFLFLTVDELKSTIVAMKSRGGLTLSGLRKSGKFYVSVFALAFMGSFNKADQIAKAMASRGYDRTLNCFL